MRVLVTGATGLAGSHVVERLLAGGHEVRALARPASDAAFLATTPAEIVRGDLADAGSLRRAVNGCDSVIHTAAVVGEWQPWDEFYRVGVLGTRRLLDAAVAAGARRFVQVSSIAVYGSRLHGRTLREFDPYDDHPEPWNHYVREKVQAERLAFSYHTRGAIEVSAVRPSVIWGRRDRAAFPRTRALLHSPLAAVVGKGLNRVPCVSARDVADVCARAATNPAAAGRAFQVSSDQELTQLDLLRAFVAVTGAAEPRLHVPFPVAMALAGAMETAFRGLGSGRPPAMTRFNLLIIAADVRVDTSLAREELGWRQLQSVPEAIAEAAAWEAGRGVAMRQARA